MPGELETLRHQLPRATIKRMTTYSERMTSAALRHLRDAQTLSGGPQPSPDQAWHLIGFAPECALKAGLSAEWQGRAIGHAGTLAEPLSGWLLDLDPSARRRLGSSYAADVIPGWTPQHRYKETGWLATTSFDLAGAIRDAEEIVIQRIATLWTAGDLPAGAVREQD